MTVARDFAAGEHSAPRSHASRGERSLARLTVLAARLEVIAHRLRTLGLARAAEDLVTISAELRRFADGAASS